MLYLIIILYYSVGKTSLLNQYVKNEFSLQYKATIGADFLTKTIDRGEEVIQLQLWDTAGAEKYHAMGSGFYRNSETCVLVFDLTDKQSFLDVETWRNEFLTQLNPPDADIYPFILLGNKSDLTDMIKVEKTDIDSYCAQHNNMPYFDTSAKDNVNLEEAFEKVADLAYARHTKNEESFVPDAKALKLSSGEVKKKKKCCK